MIILLELIPFLVEEYPGTLAQHYQLQEEGEPSDILLAIARSRGCVKTGNEADYDKAAFLLLDDFRNARLGKITLERPKQV